MPRRPEHRDSSYRNTEVLNKDSVTGETGLARVHHERVSDRVKRPPRCWVFLDPDIC